MAATSSCIGGSPIHVTSGYNGARLLKGRINVQKIYWEQPDLTSTSHMLIQKGGSTGTHYVNMKCETSGQSQQMDFNANTWWVDPYIANMPSGDLWIYYK